MKSCLSSLRKVNKMKRIILKTAATLLTVCLLLSAAAPAYAAEQGTTAPAASAPVSAADVNGDGKTTAADAREMLLAADSAQTRTEAKKQLRAMIGSEGTGALADAGIGVLDRVITAGGKAYSAAEFSYFYNSVFCSYYHQAYYYDYSYGEGYGKVLTGFDYTVSPAEQTTTDDDGNEITFAEKFRQMAIGAIEHYAYLGDLAVKAGLTPDAEDESYITESISSAAESAQSYGMTIDEYIEAQFGEGVNEYILTKIMRDQLLAQKYQDKMTEDLKAGVTDEAIESYYNENKNEFDTISGRLFRLVITHNEDETTDQEQQQKKADEFIASVKSEEDFIARAAEYDPEAFSEPDSTKITGIDFGTLDQYISSDAADWCFDGARKAGDISSFATAQYIYVIYLSSVAGRDEELLPTVRHLLVKFSDEPAPEEGSTAAYADDYRSKEDAKKLAEEYLAEYKKGDRTEESFAALADEHSDDTASTTAGGGEGGLYADMAKGQFVKEFEDWAFDANRKPGDVDIVETQFGYHVMYFVKLSDEPAWKATIRDKLAQEQTDEAVEKLSSEFEGTAVYDGAQLDAVSAYTLDVIAAAMG